MPSDPKKGCHIHPNKGICETPQSNQMHMKFTPVSNDILIGHPQTLKSDNKAFIDPSVRWDFVLGIQLFGGYKICK